MDAGVNVVPGILEDECRYANRRFITFHEKHRPYILLKFAKTSDGFIAPLTGNGKISNAGTDIFVHKWRSEEQAILIGTNTAKKDNPHLTVRKWSGLNPLRVIIDKYLSIPPTHNIFDQTAQTLIVNEHKNEQSGNIEFISTPFKDLPEELCRILFERNIQSVMIEGGSNLLEQFIKSGLWDEARIITSPKTFSRGLPAPVIQGKMIIKKNLAGDEIEFLQNVPS
jgi:diaminohydroxyphosphoribosylaminopyrimidine deaminase/5-amino-6-(5-phosphoribosylamino)uracil reductase